MINVLYKFGIIMIIIVVIAADLIDSSAHVVTQLQESVKLFLLLMYLFTKSILIGGKHDFATGWVR